MVSKSHPYDLSGVRSSFPAHAECREQELGRGRHLGGHAAGRGGAAAGQNAEGGQTIAHRSSRGRLEVWLRLPTGASFGRTSTRPTHCACSVLGLAGASEGLAVAELRAAAPNLMTSLELLPALKGGQAKGFRLSQPPISSLPLYSPPHQTPPSYIVSWSLQAVCATTSTSPADWPHLPSHPPPPPEASNEMG